MAAAVEGAAESWRGWRGSEDGEEIVVTMPPWWGDGGDGEMRRLVWWGSRRDGDDGCGGDVVDLSDEREEYA
ncbi:hypothetical protein Tco_0433669, partial [Tanacetum coccineum]